MDNFQIYNNKIPNKYENVLVKFIDRNNTHIEGELLEYNFKCMMSYNDITKKKKIYSWNKIVPLNKQMVARIDEIFIESHYVQVSIAYFTKADINNNNNDDLQKQLLKPFNDNKILISTIKNICYKNNIDFCEFWYNIIHKIDINRKLENINSSFLEYYINNLDQVKELVNEKYNNININNMIDKINYEKSYKITSKIGIISINGINYTINIIKKIIDINNDWEFVFKYETAPYYILESNSSNSTKQHHENFLNMITEQSKNNNTLFTKIDYIGMHIL